MSLPHHLIPNLYKKTTLLCVSLQSLKLQNRSRMTHKRDGYLPLAPKSSCVSFIPWQLPVPTSSSPVLDQREGWGLVGVRGEKGAGLWNRRDYLRIHFALCYRLNIYFSFEWSGQKSPFTFKLLLLTAVTFCSVLFALVVRSFLYCSLKTTL